MFEKVLIANRGEIAVRIIRTLREMGIKSVSVYSTNDKNSLHVILADESVCIGPEKLHESYLKISNILSAAEITGAEAIHPGYGLLAENSDFAEACLSSGFVFIGPSPENIKLLGDKIQARKLAKSLNIPVVPGSDEPVRNEKEAMDISLELGFPVLIKSAYGGGGRGMKVVTTPGNLKSGLELARSETEISFGKGEVFIEKYFERARHVEVQIIGLGDGNVICLGDRDCSVQRRNQKIIEEGMAPFIPDQVRKKMWRDAIKLASSINYKNAGTVEFLLDEDFNYYFLEVNTRIQVEHPVTEIVTSTDIVKIQIMVAGGEKVNISSFESVPKIHAIECRINAEDPYTFAPSPGVVEDFHFPGGPCIRVDSALVRGQAVSPLYDPLLAKIIAYGETREQALQRAKRALHEVRVKGVNTNVELLMKILNSRNFEEGILSTRIVEEVLIP